MYGGLFSMTGPARFTSRVGGVAIITSIVERGPTGSRMQSILPLDPNMSEPLQVYFTDLLDRKGRSPNKRRINLQVDNARVHLPKSQVLTEDKDDENESVTQSCSSCSGVSLNSSSTSSSSRWDNSSVKKDSTLSPPMRRPLRRSGDSINDDLPTLKQATLRAFQKLQEQGSPAMPHLTPLRRPVSLILPKPPLWEESPSSVRQGVHDLLECALEEALTLENFIAECELREVSL